VQKRKPGSSSLEVSSLTLGGNVFGWTYQLPFAERIKKETGILTGTVGLITEAHVKRKIFK
jgi:hypothetical protein